MSAITPLRLDHNEVQVWSASLDERQQPCAELYGLLSPDEKQRADRFYFDHHRQRYITGRALLRRLLSAYLALPAEQIAFGYEACGKPFLDLPWQDRTLQFNLSHSNDMALYAFSWDLRVGVDLEKIRHLPSADSIAVEHFSPNESASISALEGDAKTELFFMTWTAKEAYIKAIGEGLSVPLDKIELRVDSGRPVGVASLNGRQAEADQWRLEIFKPAYGYLASLAVEGRDRRIRFRNVEDLALIEAIMQQAQR